MDCTPMSRYTTPHRRRWLGTARLMMVIVLTAMPPELMTFMEAASAVRWTKPAAVGLEVVSVRELLPAWDANRWGCMRRGSLGVRLPGGQQLACPDSAQLYREPWIIYLFYSPLCDSPRFTSSVSCFG